MVISILKKMKILLVLFPAVLLLLYCQDEDQIIRERSARRQSKDSDTIRSIQSDDYYGRYSRGDYDGADCEDLDEDHRDYEKCMAICEKMYDKQSRDCERLPIELIFDLDRLFTEMEYIRAGDNSLNRRVSNFDFGVMIDIDITPALILIRDWSDREVAEFLIWTAKNSAVALALVYHDKENQILEEAFRRLGARSSGSATGDLERGIGTDLQSYGQTFWAIAEGERNAGAFMVMHRLVDSTCSTVSCKKKLYCIRESMDNRFRARRCHYSSSRRSFRQTHCYIHGPNVWTFWESLNDEREFKDSDFPEGTKMNEAECDRVCQTENCERT